MPQVLHEVVTFVMDVIHGQSNVTVQVIIAGQASNVLTIPVRPPTLDTIEIYETGLLVSIILDTAVSGV